MATRTTSSTDLERQIDASIDEWIEQGLVTETEWASTPLVVTPLPTGPGIHYDPERVERVLKFFRLLKQITGRWAKVDFTLLDWQVRWIIAPVFGILNADGNRVIRTVWVEIPRKNGKSTLCSGLGLLLAFADSEPAAQVYAAAGSKDQAKLVFNPARLMALGSPKLKRKLGKGILKTLIENVRTGSIFRAVSSRDDLAHGLNVHGAIVDEVHIHKTPDLVDALETGTGSREQPLIVFITTADAGETGSIYDIKHTEIERLASGVIVDPTKYGVVFGADPKAPNFDPFSTETLRAANPGFGVTVLAEYLEGKAREAQNTPSLLNRYLRLHLNIRTKQEVKWLPLDAWDATAGIVTDDDFAGTAGYGGLDLSSTSDFTAWCFIAPDERTGGWVADWLYWLPEDQLAYLARRTGQPLDRWVAEGWLTLTEGNVVHYAQIRADIDARLAHLGAGVIEIAYDPWQATETALEMAKTHKMIPLRQGYASLSAPCKEVERLIMGSTPERPMLRHGGNPISRWMADCVDVTADTAENIKPVKPDRRKSANRIDGVAALVNAMARATVGDEAPRSAYEDHDLVIVRG